MKTRLSLRQIEAFKAVIEQGTISRAANVLHVSQPAMSKMITNLELDAGLLLFDRLKGRLAPTQRGMRLYDEIDRIFAGVQQVENAIDAIRREDQGRITIGVMPALSGSFVQMVTSAFLKRHPRAFCVVESRGSPQIAEWLVTRKLDVGFVESGIDNPYLLSEPMMEHALVCVLPVGHPLQAKAVISPTDLDDQPFISFSPEDSTARHIASTMADHRAHLNVALVASNAQTVCEFVAGGHGVSLIHPVLARSFGERLIVRPFEPVIPHHFQICHSRDSRHTHLVSDFIVIARDVARTLL